MERAIAGFLLFCIGIVILVTWRDILRDCNKSKPLLEKWLLNRLGMKQIRLLSERASWIIGALGVNFLGILCLIAGSLLIYSGVTGRDWPLHHARWNDLWPF